MCSVNKLRFKTKSKLLFYEIYSKINKHLRVPILQIRPNPPKMVINQEEKGENWQRIQVWHRLMKVPYLGNIDEGSIQSLVDLTAPQATVDVNPLVISAPKSQVS